MKKIIINSLLMSEKNTMNKYIFKVLENLVPLLEKDDWNVEIVCSNDKFLPENCKKFYKHADNSSLIKRTKSMQDLNKEDYDVVYSPTQHGIINPKGKQIITIHDLTPIIYPKGRIHQYLYFKYLLPIIAKNSRKIISVSENTKKDILKLYSNIKDKNIEVINESIYSDKKKEKYNIQETNNCLDKYDLNANKYFVIIGIQYFYKNLHSIIEIYNKHTDIQDKKLIIIGNNKNGYGKYLKELVDKYKLNDVIKFTGFIEEKEKNILLNECIATIYPTKYEGYGLPVLEAFHSEVPILCSNTSSLPEVGHNAPLYFDPKDLDDIYQKLNMVSKDEKLRKSLIEKGKQVYKQYESWAPFAKQIYELINKVYVEE